MRKDTLERAREPNLNLKGYLKEAYIHPVFKTGDEDSDTNEAHQEEKGQEPELVPTKRHSRRNTPTSSIYSDELPSFERMASSLLP